MFRWSGGYGFFIPVDFRWWNRVSSHAKRRTPFKEEDKVTDAEKVNQSQILKRDKEA